MKEVRSNIIILFFVVLSIFLGTLLWSKINLPYANPEEVLGNYSKYNITPNTEALRYVLYIFIPLITFFLSFVYYKKYDYIPFQKIIKNKENPKIKENKLLNTSLYIFFLIALIQLLTSEFSLFEMDFFHEGLAMTGAYNSSLTEGLWKSSFIVTGLFYEILNPKISWFITGNETLGSWRFFNIILGFFVEILILFFCYKLSKLFNLKKNLEVVFFITLAILAIYLNREMVVAADAYRPRDIPILLFLLLSINLLTNEKQNYVICFVIGGLSVFSILWSLDKGAYINITLVGLLFLLFVRNKKHQAFFILIGLAVSWLIFYTTVGSDEFNAFISNTVSIIKTHDFLNAIVYPTPFSFSENDSARGTRNLLIIIINGIFIISALVNKKNNIPKSTTFFLLIFYTLAFINYKSGISRSDGPHMKQSIYFHLILLVTFFSFYLLNFIKKFDLDNKFTFLRKRFYIFFPLLFLILVIDKINPTNLKNIVNFKNRYLNYVQLSDENFLSNKQVQLVKKLKNLHLNENCIQTFTYESAIPYLIKKKSCTKFYVIYVIGSKKNQHNFIDKLKATKPKYILTDGPYEKYTVFSPKERFPYIFKYLQKNYQDGEKLHSWKILNLGS